MKETLRTRRLRQTSRRLYIPPAVPERDTGSDQNPTSGPGTAATRNDDRGLEGGKAGTVSQSRLLSSQSPKVCSNSPQLDY
ncbi:hypothetical protein J6590_037886 [Homalodisca vitripennis]|nr:hypothetical protein J6590_037886 [Homalodisca vitripennis]